MRLFGLEITRAKTLLPTTPTSTTALSSRGGWYSIIRESFAGAWQQNVTLSLDNVLTYSAVYACVRLISSDIGKLRIKLIEQDANGIWNEITSPAFSPVLRKPNRYQTHIDFKEAWTISKLLHGNAYVLKQRDDRRVVTALHVLEPTRVKVLVAPDGDVFYELANDPLSGITSAGITVPAREMIHDVEVPLYHPLCGVSPITACGLAATQGIRVQQQSANHFGNGSVPGGVLTAPGLINEETAKRLKEDWEANYGGENYGRVAVLGDDLKYQPIAMSAVDSQLVEQLKWTAENVCTAFGVPAYMIGVGDPPAYNNVEALNQQYYSQCLQSRIEKMEARLDDGLDLPERRGTELDLDNLLRMDTATRVKAAAESIGGGGMSPNEARKKYFGLGPVAGGAAPYLQQQNYSLEALAKRDAQADPFGTATPAPSADAARPSEDSMPEDMPAKRFERAFSAAMMATV